MDDAQKDTDQLRADLFGDDEDEPAEARPVLDDDVDDDDLSDYEPPSTSAAAGSADDRRAALQALAAKTKQRQDQAVTKKKKSKQQKGGDEEGAKPRKRRRAGSPPPVAEHQSYRGTSRVGRSEKLGAPGVGGDEEEENIDDFLETDADRAFIDDEGAEPAGDEAYGSDGDPDLVPHDEAEEAGVDDIDALLANRKKKRGAKESEGDAQAAVDGMLARMDLAAETDVEVRGRNQPAGHKLALCRAVEDFIVQRRYHERFMAASGLAVLARWLQPYSDGSLPHSRVRETVLRCCSLLNIDTANESLKLLLGRSGLAKYVMFLSKCPEETAANKASAKALVDAWSRPIFYDADAEELKKRSKMEQLRRAREQSLRNSREQEVAPAGDAPKRAVQPGEPGFRWHAAVPQSAKLDYVAEPESVYDESAAGGYNPKKTRFVAKTREIERKRKQTTQRAMKPNVEGRGMIIYS